MPANISEFRSIIFDYEGLSKLDRFKLRFPIPPSLTQMSLADGSTTREAVRFMEFFCNTADLPGVGLATRNITRYGYGAHEKMPVFPIFNDIMLTFMNDTGSINLQVFQQWLASIINFKIAQTINDTQTVVGQSGPVFPYEVTYKDDYAVDAFLSLFDVNDNERYVIALRDFYPIMIPETKLAWEQTNQIMQVVVMFSYTDWYLLKPEGMQQSPASPIVAKG